MPLRTQRHGPSLELIHPVGATLLKGAVKILTMTLHRHQRSDGVKRDLRANQFTENKRLIGVPTEVFEDGFQVGVRISAKHPQHIN